MFLNEYDEEKTMRLFYKDGYDDGREETREHDAKVLAKKLKVSFDEAMSMLTEA